MRVFKSYEYSTLLNFILIKFESNEVSDILAMIVDAVMRRAKLFFDLSEFYQFRFGIAIIVGQLFIRTTAGLSSWHGRLCQQ
jgi:hypothetical protein